MHFTYPFQIFFFAIAAAAAVGGTIFFESALELGRPRFFELSSSSPESWISITLFSSKKIIELAIYLKYMRKTCEMHEKYMRNA